MNNAAFGTIAGLENANYKTKFGTVFYDANGERYTPAGPTWPGLRRGLHLHLLRRRVQACPGEGHRGQQGRKPFLVEAPMENIAWCPGCWNINDIYSPNELVKEGKLVKKENASTSPPATPSPTTPDRDILFATCLQSLYISRRAAPSGAALRLSLLKAFFQRRCFGIGRGSSRGRKSASNGNPNPRCPCSARGRRAERGEGFSALDGAEKDRDAG